jgi:predicted RecB family nuclease
MMETGNITTAVFAAYLKCPTKGLLIARGEKPPQTFFGDLESNISEAYKAKFGNGALPSFRDLVRSSAREETTTLFDCESAFYTTKPRAAIREDAQVKQTHNYIPVLYLAWNKLDESDRLTICFGTMAVAQMTGAELPRAGEIIFGDIGRTKQVNVSEQLARKAKRTVEQITNECERDDLPPTVLNKHCQICDFQARCRSVAVNCEDLSLLATMTEKERQKFIEKGITTITQLSYGYRPRRRRRSKVTPQRVSPPVKYDNKLKAIAIKKSQVHVIGTPEFGGEGTPVFIDVEGMPDRDLYYLIGLLYQDQGRAVNRSFWANRPEDEFKIWQNCVRALREIDNPRLVHYGAYESRFLKAMRARWASTDEDTAFIDQLISGSTNLVSMIYGKLYFPTYSNSLKEIARWLGFEWTWPQASGSAAIVLRRLWELTAGDHLRRELVNYNIEDCRATELVADAIKRICRNDEQAEPTFQTVNISSLEVGFQRTFGKFAGALPEFEKINAAAYWDYQRSKVYVRTDKTVRQSLRKSAKLCTRVAVEKEVIVDDRPKVCPRCGASKIWIAVRMANVNFDLRFTRRGIKRWAVRYRYNNYRCGACKAQMTPYVSESKYGQNIRAYIAYLLLELRLSHRKLREHIATVFGVTVLNTMVNDIKQAMAKKYEPTYHVILKQIVTGPVVHADETKGVVYGGGHYVWVFANLNSVAYVYSASREASKLNEVLSGFKGVLVSDFYTAYDSLPCPQQKCLIHLMRDINEDLLKHPFNEELTFVAQQFGTVLRGIVETIDRHGLKKFYLQKHKGSAQQFLSEVASLDCSTEVGSALKKRIDKNKDKPFTFLDHDGVPWNNNNAEHAVRAFTRLRNGMATSTPKGTTDYCILLSLQQTLRYRGIEFLEFLRSGRTDM